MAAALFEAELDAAQAAGVARLTDEHRPTRPDGVVTAMLLYDGAVATLVAVWRSRDELEQYLATTDVPRGRELMRKVGVEPSNRVVDVLEHA